MQVAAKTLELGGQQDRIGPVDLLGRVPAAGRRPTQERVGRLDLIKLRQPSLKPLAVCSGRHAHDLETARPCNAAKVAGLNALVNLMKPGLCSPILVPSQSMRNLRAKPPAVGHYRA